jgi:hypothetical protein
MNMSQKYWVLDGLMNALNYDSSTDEQLALLEINQMKEWKKNVKKLRNSYGNFDHIEQHVHLDPIDKLIVKAHRRLGLVNLRTTNLEISFENEGEFLKLDSLKCYLGDPLFECLSNLCDPENKYSVCVRLKFANNAIKSLIPQDKVHGFEMKESAKNEFSENKEEYKLCDDGQRDLFGFLDDKLRRLLDFSFHGDWGGIDEFCLEAITMQVPYDPGSLTKKNTDPKLNHTR